MFQWFWRLLSESNRAEFRSAYVLTESVERLRAATKRSAFSAFSETAAVGKVSEEGVRLQRVIPMMSNSFKPFFIGRFEVRSGVTVLCGRFTMLPFVKIFMSIWFGMLLVFTVGFVIAGLSTQAIVPSFLFFSPLLLIGFGIALIAAGKWFARNDAAWLSHVIEGALGATAQSGVTTTGSGTLSADPDAVPTTLKVASLVLAASGVIALLSVRFANQLAANSPRLPEGFQVLPFGQWTFAYAAIVIGLSVGVWRRQPWAWWAGFAVLGASFLGPVFALRGASTSSPPVAMRFFVGVVALIVAAIWGRWWYAQRKHFLWVRP